MKRRLQHREPQPSFLVEQDLEGLRLAMLAVLEEGFQSSKITGSPMKPQDKKRHLALIRAKRTLSPGYYLLAIHLMCLDAERVAGIPLDPRTTAAFESAGLRMLDIARAEHKGNHPPCSRCGTQQDTRFHTECTNCGAKFIRKGGK